MAKGNMFVVQKGKLKAVTKRPGVLLTKQATVKLVDKMINKDNEDKYELVSNMVTGTAVDTSGTLVQLTIPPSDAAQRIGNDVTCRFIDLGFKLS